jgi:hypothetical protein
METEQRNDEVKAFRTFIGIYSFFESERLNAIIKLNLQKAAILSVMTYACPLLGISGRRLFLKVAALTKEGCPHYCKFPKVHTGPRFAHGFQPFVCIRLFNKIVQAASRNHTKL